MALINLSLNFYFSQNAHHLQFPRPTKYILKQEEEDILTGLTSKASLSMYFKQYSKLIQKA